MSPQDQPPICTDFATLVAEIQRPLFAYILALFPEPHDAEEILQNTNVKLIAESHRLADIRNFSGWARKLAYFEYLAHCKKSGRCRLDFVGEERLQQVADRTFERAARSTDKLQALHHCEAQLEDRDRELLDWRYRDGCSIRDIADRTRRTPAAVRQVFYRIRTALLACVERRLGLAGGRA